MYSTGSTPNNYLYRGEQYDSDLGLYYLRARYYNPITGRFMSRDPENGKPFNPKTLHKYLYANGDPVNRLDRSGREGEEEEAGAEEESIEEVEAVEEIFKPNVQNLFGRRKMVNRLPKDQGRSCGIRGDKRKARTCPDTAASCRGEFEKD